MDTFNATTRAFLGTRLGCAQCHNHRFDKWTQKQFYESAAHFWGVSGKRTFYRPEEFVWSNHVQQLAKKDKMFQNLSAYSDVILKPSRAQLWYNQNEALTYPDNYRYDNAKPLAPVKAKIVFEYGNSNIEGKDPRETFAKWLTGKENIRFAQIMPNRLWKRVMGATMMEPLDDWKDDITINNPKLLKALGDIFVDVNYDFKALLSIIFNSEAYQLATDVKNQFASDEYKFQGAMIKRMSAFQIKDSLMTLKHGNLDRFSKFDDQYFEFEAKLQKIANDYRKAVVPITKSLIASDDAANYRECRLISDEIISLMSEAMEKLKELEEYYDIDRNGYLKSQSKGIAYNKGMGKEILEKSQSMMMQQRSSRISNPKSGYIMRASYHQFNSELMETFGLSDYGAPETNLNTKATMKQILKLLNSQEVKNAIGPDSYVMQEVKKLDKFVDKIKYLYYSIYGRSPNGKDVAIAKEFLDETKDWTSYTLALLNSPEFYFVK
jgi:DNA-binding ferritin-like protein (Dps family)